MADFSMFNINKDDKPIEASVKVHSTFTALRLDHAPYPLPSGVYHYQGGQSGDHVTIYLRTPEDALAIGLALVDAATAAIGERKQEELADGASQASG